MARAEAKDEIINFQEAKTLRMVQEQQWRLNAAYCAPRDYAIWQSGDGPPSMMQNQGPAQSVPGRTVFDNTGARCMPKYQAVVNRMITPEGQKYHKLGTDNKYLQKSRAVQMFFEELTDQLFKLRYNWRARFTQAQGELYNQHGVYGTGCKTLMWRKRSPTDREGGYLYKTWPLRFVYILVDDMGNVYRIYREFWLNYRQFKRRFPDEPLPKSLDGQAYSSETKFSRFVHCVYERGGDYDTSAIDYRRMPISASYICIDDSVYIGEEEGFLTWPYTLSRPTSTAGDPYGYSPAEQAFTALGTASAVKKSMIKQGQLAVQPAILANDDGVLSGRMDIRPGKITYGGLNQQGQELVKPFNPQARFDVAEKLLEGDRADAEDCFLVTIFKMLDKNERMTTAEVYEKLSLQAGLIAPTMGRLQSEDQGPQIEREIALLAENNSLPDIPPELIEAKGEYSVNYTSPLARAMYSEEVSGFMRISELAINVAAQTGNRKPLFYFNWDIAIPEIAWRVNSPTRWINDQETVDKMMADEAQRMQAEQLMKAAPAAASVVTAAMKQGGGITP